MAILCYATHLLPSVFLDVAKTSCELHTGRGRAIGIVRTLMVGTHVCEYVRCVERSGVGTQRGEEGRGGGVVEREPRHDRQKLKLENEMLIP